MNAHLVLLIVVTSLFATVWNCDGQHCEAARVAAAANRPAIVQRSAMASLTIKHRHEVMLAKQKASQAREVVKIAGDTAGVVR